MKNQPGVYFLVDPSSDKFYVGSTVNLEKRLRDHDNLLQAGNHHNRKLQQLVRQGKHLEVHVQPTATGKEALDLEQECLDELFDTDRLLNIARDATAPNRGIKQSPEHVEKRRQAMLGFKHSPETLALLSDIAKERGMPRTVIEAGAAARRGKPLSAEHVEKVRQTSKERMTPEAREHLRQLNLGVKHTPEDIERMKAVKRQNSGRAVSIEGRTFGSIAEAAETLHISPGLVRLRINDPAGRFPAWSYLT